MKKQFDLAGVVKNRIVDRKMLKPGDLLDHPALMTTSVMRGAFRHSESARAEFLSIAQK